MGEPGRGRRPRPGVVAAAVLLAACARVPRAPHVLVGGAPLDLDAFVAAHPVTPDRPIRVEEVGRTAGASYHLVQACADERPHRHAVHDLTAIVLRGHGRLHRPGAPVDLRPGDVAVVPRGVPHWMTRVGGGCAVAVVVFTPPLEAPDSVPVD